MKKIDFHSSLCTKCEIIWKWLLRVCCGILQANCIHLSDAASLAMSAQRKDIPLVYRGYRHIKGKGDMHTFWIQGYHPMQAGSQASAAEGICSAFDVSVQRGRSISAPFIGSSMPYTNTHYHPRQSAATPPAIKSLM